jgi:hypothetical protein
MNRLSRITLALVLAVSCVAVGRGGDDKKAASSWYPLAVGNTWTYRIGEGRFQIKVTKTEKVGQTECARLELIVNNKPTSHEHIAVVGDQLQRFSFEGKKADPPITFLKLPPQKGQKWNVETKIDGQLLKGTLETGVDKLVKVHAGEYKDVVTVTGRDLDVNNVKMSVTWYFAEKVGMIRQVVELAGQKIVIELEKFEPGK